MNGLPPHIAQVICGHKSLDTTMGYKAIYPAETIEAHRAFIARRRATRPSEEYRTPTEEEWDAFLAHFEKRKVSIGTCGRAFSNLVFMNMLAFVARSSGRTRPSAAGWRRSATTSSPASPRPSGKAGSEKSKGSGSASPAPKTSSFTWTDKLPAVRRSTSACQA